MNIRDKIVNLEGGDYHMHSLNFSDGLNTVDEMVRFAGEIGLKEIAITDHSQKALDYTRKKYGIFSKTQRRHAKRYKNAINDVNVIFGVETDLLNEEGEVCFDILGTESDFNILSLHKGVYNNHNGDENKITEAYIKAIEKHHKKIKLIGHPCKKPLVEKLDIKKLVEVANNYNIALEFDATNFIREKTDLEKLDYLLQNSNKIYINSDAHNLYELKYSRKKAIEYLEEKGYL